MEKLLSPMFSPVLLPILLLSLSNVFMTFAWYGHLKYPNTSLWVVVPIAWGIAFFEYCLAVPANRIGHQVWTAAELKTFQEVITLIVFAAVSQRSADHQPRHRICADRPGGVFRFSRTALGSDSFTPKWQWAADRWLRHVFSGVRPT